MARYKRRKRNNPRKTLAAILTLAVIICAILFIKPLFAEKNGEIPKEPEANQGEIIETPENNSETPESQPEPTYEEKVGKEYKIDIEKYLKYIEPENKYEYVFLVNPENPLSKDFEPEDLTDCGHTRKDGRATQKLRKNAAESLKAFLAEAKEYGFSDITVTSAYRSYSYQDYLFNMYFENDWKTGKYKTKAECEAHTLTYSTKPGTSEHQSGLCLDMHNHPSATDAFGGTKEADWLEDNCYRFGFILRYPKDTIHITGIKYEPWHFRYVGREVATEIHNLGITLDEYVEQNADKLN